MLLKTYINTLKNLFRSKTFWLMVCLLVVATVQGASDGYYGGDNDAETVLYYNDYIQVISNCCISTLLQYVMPIFAIINVAVIVNRDYGDKLFEIEKSAGAKPSLYVIGRIAALTTVNGIALVIAHCGCFYLYIYTRNGVDGMTWYQILSDSFVRILRVDLFVALPCILFYMGTAYLIGNLFKSGVAATVLTSSYAMGYFLINLIFRHRIGETYFNYFSPIPKKLRQYFHFYDTEWFEELLAQFDLSLGKAAFCIAFLCGIFVLGVALSYLITRRRNA